MPSQRDHQEHRSWGCCVPALLVRHPQSERRLGGRPRFPLRYFHFRIVDCQGDREFRVLLLNRGLVAQRWRRNNRNCHLRWTHRNVSAKLRSHNVHLAESPAASQWCSIKSKRTQNSLPLWTVERNTSNTSSCPRARP